MSAMERGRALPPIEVSGLDGEEVCGGIKYGTFMRVLLKVYICLGRFLLHFLVYVIGTRIPSLFKYTYQMEWNVKPSSSSPTLSAVNTLYHQIRDVFFGLCRLGDFESSRPLNPGSWGFFSILFFSFLFFWGGFISIDMRDVLPTRSICVSAGRRRSLV